MKTPESVKRFASRITRDRFTTGLELAGAAAVTYGVAEIYVPAGWIVGGILLAGLAFLLDFDGGPQ